MGLDTNNANNASNITALASRQAVLDFQDLQAERRSKGFVHFIPDLKEITTQGQGWSITSGKLVVRAEHNTHELMQFLDNQLKDYPWYETTAKYPNAGIPAPVLPHGFNTFVERFKAVGAWGKNRAVDLIAFVENDDGSLSLQVITRKFDQKRAIIGTMMGTTADTPEAKKAKIIETMLEKIYGMDLFTPGSTTLQDASQLNIKDLNTYLATILNENEFEPLKEITQGLINAFQTGTNLPDKLANLKQALNINGLQHNLTQPALDVFWLRIRCNLYKQCFATAYQAFTSFLDAKLVAMPETTNEADPKNTQVAYMTTTPYYFHCKAAELSSQQVKWKLQPKGGMDGSVPSITMLDTVFNEPIFASHGRITLEALADLVTNRPYLLENECFEKQLTAIGARIVKRETDQNHLTCHDGIWLQQEANGPAHLPIMPSGPQLQQFQRINPSAGYQLNAGVYQAQLHFGEGGGLSLARIEQKLLELGLPSSAMVTLEEVRKLQQVNILIDNSGSMTQPFKTGLNQDSTRWEEARRRLLYIVPLLALAGVSISFRQINNGPKRQDGARLSADTTTSFTFPRDLEGDNLALYENTLMTMLNFINFKLFAQTPDGGTNINKHLSDFFALAPKMSGNQQLNLFITDGDVHDEDAVTQTLRARNASQNPLIVVACTNTASDIEWVRNLPKDIKGVSMLEDYRDELSRIRVIHGSSIPYFESIYWLQHVTVPATTLEEAKGLQLLGITNTPFTKVQLESLMGYDSSMDVTYKFYTNRCPLLQESLKSKEELCKLVSLVNMPENTYGFYVQSYNAFPRPQQASADTIAAESSVTMHLLLGFSAVLGLAAVAVAFTLLSAASLNPVGLALAGLGSTVAVLALNGLFATKKPTPPPFVQQPPSAPLADSQQPPPYAAK